MQRDRITTFSVFGQINAIVADAMVAEGKATRIEPNMIPDTVRFDDKGQEAHCALRMTRTREAEFDDRVRRLRA